MRFILITRDPEVVKAAKDGFHPSDKLQVIENWQVALENSEGIDLIFVDLLATLKVPHHVEGYEEFAAAKMEHPVAAGIPLVLIGALPNYKIDFMVGWPNFLLGHLQRPVDYRQFRRASTWI